MKRKRQSRPSGRQLPPPKPPGEDLPPRRRWIGITAAAVAAVGFFALLRLLAPLPWDYDEFYHVGLARELHGGMPAGFHWTPFSLMYEHFVDPVPLFHLLLMPFAGLSIEHAALAGALLGQLLVVGSFAWVLWRLEVPYASIFVLALTAMGTDFAARMAMCRPHHGEIGFSILFLGLLVLDASPVALAVVAAAFGLFHASGWMPVLFAAIWLVANYSVPIVPAWRRWAGVAASALGWLVSQLVHPAFPYNLRLLWFVNVTVLRQSAGGDMGLRSQVPSELQPLSGDLLFEQWPTLLAAAGLVALLALSPTWRRRQVVVIGGLAMAFLFAGVFLWRRFFELAAPLTLLALALGTLELPGSPARRKPEKSTLAAFVVLIVMASTFTFARLHKLRIGTISPPTAMSEWLAEHGRAGERVFTANWADSEPLFYYAPQLQSLVALDPTAFWIVDPERFGLYVRIIEGREIHPARAIRERFGARWVTIWKVPAYRTFARELASSGEATVAFADPFYLVFDLGEPHTSH